MAGKANLLTLAPGGDGADGGRLGQVGSPAGSDQEAAADVTHGHDARGEVDDLTTRIPEAIAWIFGFGVGAVVAHRC